MKYTLSDIANIIHKKAVINDPDYQWVAEPLFDTRLAIRPKEGLFFALTGIRDGHNFIANALTLGINNFIIDNKAYLPLLERSNYILVENTLYALQKIAAFHRSQVTLNTCIGITGSYGKTIVKEWLYQVLQRRETVYRSPKSFNSKIGLPISILQMNHTYKTGIFEVGISAPGDMDNLEAMLQPDVCILTHMGEAHLHNFADFKTLCKEKFKLFPNTKKLICNADQADVLAWLRQQFPEKEIYTWGSHAGCTIQVLCWPTAKKSAKLNVAGKTYELNLTIYDKPSVENILYVLTTILVCYPDYFEEALRHIQLLEALEMRYEIKNGLHESILINDAYTTDSTTLQMALKQAQNRLEHHKLSLVMSALVVPPNISEKDYYQTIFETIGIFPVQKFIGIGAALEAHIPRSQFEEVLFFENVDKALNSPVWRKLQKEIVLFKGARAYRLERLFKMAAAQLHDAVLEVDLHAIGLNLVRLCQPLKPKTKLMVMVKANGYGCGAVEVSKYLQERKVDYLAVAYEDEGIELRNQGISIPIMVMNPSLNSLELYPKYQLEPEVYHPELLERILELSTTPWKIHLKINTGMNRLGFSTKNIDQLVLLLKKIPRHVEVASIFTHLSASDSPTQESFTREQVATYEKIVQKVSEVIGYQPTRHVLNTAGVIMYPEYQFEMVRAGIGLYGVNPSHKTMNFQRVITLKARISQIIDLVEGESIGYGRSFRASAPMRIATISIGYADGLNRRLSNGNWLVQIGEVMVPIVGRVCMDMTMVDVSNCPDVYRGQEVILIGKNNSLEKMAATLETIPYEILVGISNRIKRIYYLE